MLGLEFIAAELENPFGEDANDLPICEMQRAMNASLMSLIRHQMWKVPELSSGAVMRPTCSDDAAVSIQQHRKTLVAGIPAFPKDFRFSKESSIGSSLSQMSSMGENSVCSSIYADKPSHEQPAATFPIDRRSTEKAAGLNLTSTVNRLIGSKSASYEARSSSTSSLDCKVTKTNSKKYKVVGASYAKAFAAENYDAAVREFTSMRIAPPVATKNMANCSEMIPTLSTSHKLSRDPWRPPDVVVSPKCIDEIIERLKKIPRQMALELRDFMKPEYFAEAGFTRTSSKSENRDAKECVSELFRTSVDCEDFMTPLSPQPPLTSQQMRMSISSHFDQFELDAVSAKNICHKRLPSRQGILRVGDDGSDVTQEACDCSEIS